MKMYRECSICDFQHLRYAECFGKYLTDQQLFYCFVVLFFSSFFLSLFVYTINTYRIFTKTFRKDFPANSNISLSFIGIRIIMSVSRFVCQIVHFDQIPSDRTVDWTGFNKAHTTKLMLAKIRLPQQKKEKKKNGNGAKRISFRHLVYPIHMLLPTKTCLWATFLTANIIRLAHKNHTDYNNCKKDIVILVFILFFSTRGFFFLSLFSFTHSHLHNTIFFFFSIVYCAIGCLFCHFFAISPKRV